jgi:hypothetical protein
MVHMEQGAVAVDQQVATVQVLLADRCDNSGHNP